MSTKWNSQLYDESHAFVSNFGKGVMDLLDPVKGERILDLGCGTGDLANQLFAKGADVIGIDQSEAMILEARKKYPHLSFIVDDATQLTYEEEFDAIFSNATLHWIRDAKQALICIYKSLKPGGRFVAEFGGKGNIQEITTAVLQQFFEMGIDFSDEQFPWYFPSIGEYTSLMETVGFSVTHAQLFDRPTPLDGLDGLRNWLEMFGHAFFASVTEMEKEQVIQGVEKRLKETQFRNGKWMADYTRIRVVGIK